MSLRRALLMALAMPLAVNGLERSQFDISSGRRISGLSCSISRGESSRRRFTSTLSMTASKIFSRCP